MIPQTIILYGFLASLAAGLMTTVGAIPCLFIKKISAKFEDTTLGFAAGVMLGASFFSLIVPGLDYADELWMNKYLSVLAVLGGLLVGVLSIWGVERYSPHEHFVIKKHYEYEGGTKEKILKIWLFIIAITIHNMPEGLAVGVGFGGGNLGNAIALAIGIGIQNAPEGLAVGVGFGGGDLGNAIALAIGIGIQNAPEGLAVAFALLTIGYKRLHAFLIAGATGLFEPVMGLVGVSIVTIFLPILPVALGFAAGAMLFVISHEIIPETHRRGHENWATSGFTVGLLTMLSLDILLG